MMFWLAELLVVLDWFFHNSFVWSDKQSLLILHLQVARQDTGNAAWAFAKA